MSQSKTFSAALVLIVLQTSIELIELTCSHAPSHVNNLSDLWYEIPDDIASGLKGNNGTDPTFESKHLEYIDWLLRRFTHEWTRV